VPDGNRWLYGAGATAQLTDKLQMDAAFAYIDFADSTVDHNAVFYEGTPAATIAALRGQVTGSGYVLSVGLKSRF
jgi:long-chain fatty acid transport protein